MSGARDVYIGALTAASASNARAEFDYAGPTMASSLSRTERARVLRLRDALGMTQRELADEFGVAPAAVAQWESGQRRMSGPAMKLLELYEVEAGLDERDLSTPPSGAPTPVGSFARRKGALEALALWSIYRYLAADADPSSIAGRLRFKSLERYVETASRLKGLSMKLLQMMAFMDMVVDEQDRKSLVEAHRKAATMPTPMVTAVFKKAFGREPSDLFATWEVRPFDVTSLGQVHRATLDDRRKVVVKVQYPFIVKALKADLEDVSRLDRLYALMARGQEAGVVFAEIRERFLDECDYELEARHQREFGKIFGDWRDIHVPEVIEARSAKTVLSTELVEGRAFDDFAAHAPQESRDRASFAIWSFLVESVHRHGLLNADVHPGNYVFRDDGRVSFIDFGRVKRFPPAFVAQYRAVTRAILERNRDACGRVLDAMGVTCRGFDYEAGFRTFAYMHLPVLVEGPYAFGPEFVQRSWHLAMTNNPNRGRMNLGRDHVFWHQFHFGGAAIHARLRARIECRPSMLDAVYEPGQIRPRAYTALELAELERFGAADR